jgi:anti-sigma regulatory factor (Ser/Thr protein kinase)
VTPHIAPPHGLLTPAGPRPSRWLELPTHRASVKIARDVVREQLFAWRQAGDLCTDAVLLISELATNAVLHARGGRMLCGVELLTDARLRVEVHDECGDRDQGELGLPRRSPAAHAENGRGLLLVQQIADAWGVTRSTRTTGNAVWAALRTGI